MSLDGSSPVSYTLLPDHPLWDRMLNNRKPVSFCLEVTARCNNNCRHCYINLPEGDQNALRRELSLDEIGRIADEAAKLGALWCLITGGEPLLRKDFKELYLLLKKKGFFVTVFTNATLIDESIVDLFKKYPPRDIEVSVYGVTRETYEKVTQKKGSFDAFMHGLGLLLDNGIKVNLKAMAMKSNVQEMGQIAAFCRERSNAKYRFDPMLHLRYDRNSVRNKRIIAERLTPEEVVNLETHDPERFGEMMKKCDDLVIDLPAGIDKGYIFKCGVGKGDFTISYDGKFKLCSSLCNPGLVYDLRAENSTIADAFHNFVPRVLNMRSRNVEYLEKCGSCNIKNLCLCCPAHAWLETGSLDKPAEYFCDVARARAGSLKDGLKSK